MKIILTLSFFLLTKNLWAQGLSSFSQAGPARKEFLKIKYEGVYNSKALGSQTQAHILAFSLPLWQGQEHQWTMPLSSTLYHLGEKNLSLHPSARSMPTTLWDDKIGVNYNYNLSESKSLSLSFNFGSASDRPFASSDVLATSMMARYSFSSDKQSKWMVGLFYSSNSTFLQNIPIPTFGYMYFSQKVFLMAGLPYIVLNWFITDLWQYSLTVFGPSAQTEVIYGVRRALQGFVGWNWKPQSFMRYQRQNKDDRLFYQEQKAYAGVKWPFLPFVHWSLQGGKSFNRKLHEGEGLTKKAGGKLELEDSYFVQSGIEANF